MKKNVFIFLSFVLFSFPLFASMSKLEMRNGLIYAQRDAIEKKMGLRLKSEEIGEWQKIIDDALFALIRRSELYRGRISVVVFQDSSADCTVYPDLSVFISSGLLEYIDDCIFSSLSESLRRAKNINADREEYLAAFLSFELSRFALDIDVAKYEMQKRLPTRKLDRSEVFLVDKMANVFLKVAGYRTFLMEEHLERLQNTTSEGGMYNFGDEFSQNINERLEVLRSERDSIEKLSEEILNIIFQINTQQGLEELITNIQLLRSSYPSSIYFLRLEVVARHSIFLERSKSLAFIPILPVAILGHTYAEKYYVNIDKKIKGTPFISNATREPKKDGDDPLLIAAISLYKEYLDQINEDVLLSSYITLLSMDRREGGLEEGRAKAEEMLKRGDISIAQKINCAISFFLSQKNVQKGTKILEDVLKSEKKEGVFASLNDSVFFDERLVLYNYALFLAHAKVKNEKAIEDVVRMLKAKVYSHSASIPLLVRLLKIGDETDRLTKIWGEPSSIVYNYYFEKWVYNTLKALVVISSYSQPPKVMQIILLPGSTVSLVGDVRIGDDRASFEGQFGHSVYRAGDYEVYFYGDVSLHVLYSNEGLVRQVSIFQVFVDSLK